MLPWGVVYIVERLYTIIKVGNAVFIVATGDRNQLPAIWKCLEKGVHVTWSCGLGGVHCRNNSSSRRRNSSLSIILLDHHQYYDTPIRR
jgi:hypothetical protein